MNVKRLKKLIEKRLREPAPVVESACPEEIHVWWHGLYGTIRETNEGFFNFLRLSQASEQGECYSDFDDQGYRYKQDGATAESAVKSLTNDLEKRAKELDDPKFGATMTVDNVGEFKWHSEFEWWEGKAFLPFWGDAARVNVEPPPGGTADEHLAFLQEIVAYDGDVRTPFAAAVFDWYIKNEIHGSFAVVDANHNEYPEEAERMAPKLSEPQDVWPLIEPPPRLCIGRADPEAKRFRLTMGCTWDPEHGLGVIFEDWKIVYLGDASGTC